MSIETFQNTWNGAKIARKVVHLLVESIEYASKLMIILFGIGLMLELRPFPNMVEYVTIASSMASDVSFREFAKFTCPRFELSLLYHSFSLLVATAISPGNGGEVNP